MCVSIVCVCVCVLRVAELLYVLCVAEVLFVQRSVAVVLAALFFSVPMCVGNNIDRVVVVIVRVFKQARAI